MIREQRVRCVVAGHDVGHPGQPAHLDGSRAVRGAAVAQLAMTPVAPGPHRAIAAQRVERLLRWGQRVGLRRRDRGHPRQRGDLTGVTLNPDPPLPSGC